MNIQLFRINPIQLFYKTYYEKQTILEKFLNKYMNENGYEEIKEDEMRETKYILMERVIY